MINIAGHTIVWDCNVALNFNLKMKKTLILLAMLWGGVTLQAQDTNNELDSLLLAEMPESMQKEMDSLYWNWHSKMHISFDDNCLATNTNPVVTDSLYIDRLSRIPSDIELPFNEPVKKYIEQYSGRLRKTVAYMLAANNFYLPFIEEALDLYGLPQELKYLPVIESALNPSAVSRRGAAGLWQFMLKTGKLYGLENNSLVDERRDPIKSTWAAVRYLKDLHGIYNDWTLAIAAYNCGPGNVNKAIKRAGGSTDYWTIYGYLPRETRGYVPAFIAANYIMNYYCEHGICPMDSELPAASDTIHISQDLHLQQVADVCSVEIEQLRSLNPQYKKDLVPGSSKVSPLRLPEKLVLEFIEKKDSIFAYNADKYLKRRKTVAIKESKSSSVTTTKGGATYHKIRSGDTLGGIAIKYGTTVKKLKELNNMQGNKITAGKNLRVK